MSECITEKVAQKFKKNYLKNTTFTKDFDINSIAPLGARQFKKLASRFVSELKHNAEQLHTELTSTMIGGNKHSVAVVTTLKPTKSGILSISIEIFDPNGAPSQNSIRNPSKNMHSIHEYNLFVLFQHYVREELKNLIMPTRVNIEWTNIKSINPWGHCNSWSLYYHYARSKNNYQSIKKEVQTWKKTDILKINKFIRSVTT